MSIRVGVASIRSAVATSIPFDRIPTTEISVVTVLVLVAALLWAIHLVNAAARAQTLLQAHLLEIDATSGRRGRCLLYLQVLHSPVDGDCRTCHEPFPCTTNQIITLFFTHPDTPLDSLLPVSKG